jgi:hypothetical protein
VTTSNFSPLLNQVIQAHGGWERWQSVETIDIALNCGGFAFVSRMQPFALRKLRVSVRPHERFVTFNGYSGPGRQGIWTPAESRILDASGAVIGRWNNDRASYARLGKQFRWSHLDLLYFAGYAIWNYLSFPFLLGLPGVRVSQRNSGGRILDASFDEGIATHSQRQSFHIDDNGLLLRHDYTANVIGSWAHAANFCLDSVEIGGLRFYHRRVVYPRFGENTIVRFPTLVWIEIDDIRINSKQGGIS